MGIISQILALKISGILVTKSGFKEYSDIWVAVFFKGPRFRPFQPPISFFLSVTAQVKFDPAFLMCI